MTGMLSVCKKFMAAFLMVWIIRQMWSYMEHTSLVLEGVVKALNALDTNEATSAKSNLTSRSVRTRRNKQGMLVRRRTKTMCGGILYVTNKDGELIPGLLIYLMEGIMPMLKVQENKWPKFMQFVKLTFP